MFYVDRPAYLRLDGHRPIKGVAIACIRNDQHIHVAMRRLRSCCHRAEDQCHVDWQAIERRPDHVGYAKGFACETAKLFEERTLSVGLELLKVSSRNLGDNSRFDKLLHFPLDRRCVHAGNSGEFSQMYRAIGLRK